MLTEFESSLEFVGRDILLLIGEISSDFVEIYSSGQNSWSRSNIFQVGRIEVGKFHSWIA